jgi:hypothetical protein
MGIAILAAAVVIALTASDVSHDDYPACGKFDTALLRADMEAGRGRTDKEWRETIVKELAWQLDCERRAVSADRTTSCAFDD